MCQCTFKAKQDERKYMFIAKIDNQGLYSDSIPNDQLAIFNQIHMYPFIKTRSN